MFNLFKSQEAQQSEKPFIHKDMTMQEAHTLMLQLMAEESTNHYRMGELYNYIVDNKLAEGAGFKNASDYVTQKLPDTSESTLRGYGAVAANFSEPVARRSGVTCLQLLLIYKEAADLEVDTEAPFDTLIEVPGKEGEVTPKAFSECSVSELRLAIQRKRKPASSKPLPAEVRAQAEQYIKGVNKRISKLPGFRMQLRNHKGKAVFDLKSIPLPDMRKLAEALLAALPAKAEAGSVEKAPPAESGS
jgi:hypothetical protein